MKNTLREKKRVIEYVPNILSLIRLILALFFPFCYLFLHEITALCLFAFALVTDLADGIIARKFNAISRTGKWLDPLADKTLKMSALLTFCIAGHLPWWIFIVLASMEIGIILAGGILLKVKKYISASGWIGKISANIIYLALILCAFNIIEVRYAGTICLYIGLCTTFLAGTYYLFKFILQLHGKLKGEQKFTDSTREKSKKYGKKNEENKEDTTRCEENKEDIAKDKKE